MSAIVGIFNRDTTPVDPAAIEAMMDAIAFYGPDRCGMWVDGPIGLGHLLLVVTPESTHEQQPLVAPASVVSADARIDNRGELFRLLDIAPPHDHLPDSVLIQAAYERWGTECPLHLVGDYACAIWDAHKRSLMLMCDHISARPLYYALTPQRIVFATDVRALWAGGVPHLPNEETIAASLEKYPFVPQDDTLYAGVRKLRFGHRLVVHGTEAAEEQYWFPFRQTPLRLRDEQAYADELRRILQEAVDCRVRTAYPVAAHISAGLDSTGVAVLASRTLRAQGRSLEAGYSWAPQPSEAWPLGEQDDRRLIDRVGETEGIPITYIDGTPEDFLQYVGRFPNVGAAPNYASEVQVMRDAARRWCAGCAEWMGW